MQGTIRHRLMQWVDSPLALLLPGSVLGMLYAIYGDIAPFYDSAGYALCVQEAASWPTALLHLRCGGHPTLAPHFLLALSQILMPGSPRALYAVHLLLALGAVWAFHSILRRLSPAQHSLERLLATCIFAFTPLFVVQIFFLNPDFALTVFTLLTLALLLAERYWWAALTGAMLIFTKETGIGVYLALVVLTPIALQGQSGAPWRRRWKTMLPLLIPLACLGLYAGWILALGEPLTFGSAILQGHWREALFGFPLRDPGLRTFLVNIFVLNFQWLVTLAALPLLCIRMFGEKPGPKETPTRLVVFLSLLLCALVFLVTRVRPWMNPRYVTVTAPILLLLAFASISSLVSTRRERIWILAIILGCFLVSNVRTVDPVSRRFFGTFPFGSHSLLTMSRFGGWNRDEIVYNLEVLHLPRLTARAFRDLEPEPETVFVTGERGNYSLPFAVRRTDGSPVLPGAGTFRPILLDQATDTEPKKLLPRLNGKPFHFIEFPNLQNEAMLTFLQTHYRLLAVRTEEEDGYVLRVHTFTEKRP